MEKRKKRKERKKKIESSFRDSLSLSVSLKGRDAYLLTYILLDAIRNFEEIAPSSRSTARAITAEPIFADRFSRKSLDSCTKILSERKRERGAGPFFSATYYRYLSRDRGVSTTRVGASLGTHVASCTRTAENHFYASPDPIRSFEPIDLRSSPLNDNDFESVIKEKGKEKRERRIARKGRSSSPKVKRPRTARACERNGKRKGSEGKRGKKIKRAEGGGVVVARCTRDGGGIRRK